MTKIAIVGPIHDDGLSVLKKQSRQAVRYRNIQDDIKRVEAAIFYQKWSNAEKDLKNDNENLKKQENLVTEKTNDVAKINISFEEQQNKIPELRNKDNLISADLQKINSDLDNYEKEINRVNLTTSDLGVQLKQVEQDITREKALKDDALRSLRCTPRNNQTGRKPFHGYDQGVFCFGIFVQPLRDPRDPSGPAPLRSTSYVL